MDETRQQKQAGRKKRVGRGVKYKRLPLLSAKREDVVNVNVVLNVFERK